jgi:hypothetical protein
MGFRVKAGLGRLPETGSALHHLVTAPSVKKALTIGTQFCPLLGLEWNPVVHGARTPLEYRVQNSCWIGPRIRVKE